MKKSIRMIALMCAALTACAVMTACDSKTDANTDGNADSNTSADSGDVTELRYYTWTSEQEGGMSASIAAFEEANPKISVDMQITAWDQYFTKLQTEFVGGACADIFMNQTWYFNTLQEAGGAEPLTPLIEADGYSMDGHRETVMDIYTQDGVLYAMPQDWDCSALIYNKDLFDEYGVEYPDETLEWNPEDGGTFLEMVQKTTMDTNGNNALSADFDASSIDTYGFVVSRNLNTCIWNFMATNGGDIIEYNHDSDAQAFQFIQDLMYKYNVAPQQSAVQSMDSVNMFASGTVSMYTDGNWSLSTLRDTCDFNFGVAVLPSGPAGRTTLVNGIGQSMYSGGKNKDAAWEFLKWLGSDDSQKILAETGTIFPSKEAMWDEYIGYWADQGVDMAAYTETFAVGDTYSAPLVPNWFEKEEACNTNFDLLLTNGQSGQETADALAADFAEIDG